MKNEIVSLRPWINLLSRVLDALESGTHVPEILEECTMYLEETLAAPDDLPSAGVTDHVNTLPPNSAVELVLPKLELQVEAVIRVLFPHLENASKQLRESP